MFSHFLSPGVSGLGLEIWQMHHCLWNRITEGKLVCPKHYHPEANPGCTSPRLTPSSLMYRLIIRREGTKVQRDQTTSQAHSKQLAEPLRACGVVLLLGFTHIPPSLLQAQVPRIFHSTYLHTQHPSTSGTAITTPRIQQRKHPWKLPELLGDP